MKIKIIKDEKDILYYRSKETNTFHVCHTVKDTKIYEPLKKIGEVELYTLSEDISSAYNIICYSNSETGELSYYSIDSYYKIDKLTPQEVYEEKLVLSIVKFEKEVAEKKWYKEIFFVFDKLGNKSLQNLCVPKENIYFEKK